MRARERALHPHQRFGGGPLQAGARRRRIDRSPDEVVGRCVAQVEPQRRVERGQHHEVVGPFGAGDPGSTPEARQHREQFTGFIIIDG